MVFEVKDLVMLVKRGQWRAASSYVADFVERESRSDEATLLLRFLQDPPGPQRLRPSRPHRDMPALGLVPKHLYKEPVLAEYPCFATLVADVLFLRSYHAGYGYEAPSNFLLLQCLPELASR